MRPASRKFVARMMPSIVDWPVPKRLSNRCLVMASLTATIGYPSLPCSAMARRRITPVVVSSVPPMHLLSEHLPHPAQHLGQARRERCRHVCDLGVGHRLPKLFGDAEEPGEP